MCEQNAYHPKDPFPSSHCTHKNQLTFRVGQQGGRSRESPGGITNTSRSRSWCYEGRCRCNERGEHDDLHVGIFRFVSAVGGGADVCLSFHLLDPQLQWEEEDWGVSDSAVIHYHTVNVVALDDRDEGPTALKECISTCNCYFRQVVVDDLRPLYDIACYSMIPPTMRPITTSIKSSLWAMHMTIASANVKSRMVGTEWKGQDWKYRIGQNWMVQRFWSQLSIGRLTYSREKAQDELRHRLSLPLVSFLQNEKTTRILP